MKVLVLSQHYWPETFRINEVVESLQQAGCSVSVLTGQPNYPDGAIFPDYRAMGMGPQLHEAGYMIYRVPVSPRRQGRAMQLISNYLSFLVSASLVGPWLLRGQHFDVIFVYGISPILQAIPGVVLKRFKRAALVTWVQDLWPQSLQATGFVRDRRILALVGGVVRWIYRHSDLLLVQSRGFVSVVQAMASKTPIEYHPNPGELAFGQALPAGAPAFRLDPGFNVVFAGNMGTVQALDTLLQAAELLLPHLNVRLVLVGSGSRSEWLRQQIAQRGLLNVHLPGRFEPEDMPGILAQASALLVSLTSGPILSQTVPSKVQAYLAAGRPIIASLDGEGARVVEEAGAGLACPAEDAPALAQVILRLRAMPEAELKRMGDSGRRYYQQHFEPTMLAKRLVQHFEKLVRR
ncbi:glycosyltransferase family 4 protein [Polaromonas sp.]|uniref:glycosyltransferase family 4 protein n=1 Tax=Polaromonas sp. TaxID=1869339 RepID=UPI00286B37E1|nr:glycosyltransferase family 4 protein [Polaromonas sp.]